MLKDVTGTVNINKHLYIYTIEYSIELLSSLVSSNGKHYEKNNHFIFVVTKETSNFYNLVQTKIKVKKQYLFEYIQKNR